PHVRLAEEANPERTAPRDRPECTARIRLERRDGHGGLRGDAAPEHLQRRVGRSDPRQLLGNSAVADCGTAAEREREHRRACRDPEPDEQRTTGRRPQADEREISRIRSAPQAPPAHARPHIRWIIARPKAEPDPSVAPSMSRARSYVTCLSPIAASRDETIRSAASVH